MMVLEAAVLSGSDGEEEEDLSPFDLS